MKYSPQSLQIPLAAALLAFSAGLSGCWDGSGLRGRNTARTTTPPTPEERFELVLGTFRRGVETGVGGVSSGFVTSDEGTRSLFVVNNKVSSEVFAPETDDEPYRATITVTSLSRYSMTRDVEEKDERTKEGKDDTLAQEQNDLARAAGIDILDSDLVSVPTDQRAKPGRSGPRASDDPVTHHEDEDVRHYDLIYVDGRWKLTDETADRLDESTERAIINAFQEAFKAQG